MRFFWIFLYFILVLFGIAFSVLNAAKVQVNFYFSVFDLRLSVLMIIVFSLGLILGCCLFLCRYWRLKFAFSKLTHRLQLTETEIKNLRNIPLKNEH